MLCRTAVVVALLIAFSDAAPPTAPQFHVPFTGGCCADVTALGEYQGVAHLFKENTGVPGGRGLGFAHYVYELAPGPRWYHTTRCESAKKLG